MGVSRALGIWETQGRVQLASAESSPSEMPQVLLHEQRMNTLDTR